MAEAIDDLEIQGRTIGIAPVGCAVLAYEYFDVDFQEAAHGRAPAVAYGVRRDFTSRSHRLFLSGRWDLASDRDGDEIIHAATRGENITVIFVNNTVYGMTGGQMAPTTLPGKKTTTSPYGRDTATVGYPIRVCELLATLDGPAYLERVSVHDPQHIIKAGRAIRKAFATQVAGKASLWWKSYPPARRTGE